MKKIIATLLMASLLTLPAAAAIYVPSAEHYHPEVIVNPEDDENPEWYASIHEDDDSVHDYIYVNGVEELVVHFLEDGTDDEGDREMIIFGDGEHHFDRDAEDEIEKLLTDAEDELLNGDLTELIENFAEEWENRVGSPIENVHLVKVFDACVDEATAQHFAEGRTIRFDVKIDNLDPSDKFVVIAKERGSDKWTVVDYVIDENGEITLDMEICTTFAILADSAANPVIDEDTPKSPQTGVEAYTAIFAAGALVLLGGAVVFGKKAAKEN